MNRTLKSLTAASLIMMGTSPAFADTAASSDNPWMVRARVINVMPDESGSLSTGGTPLIGDVDIETSIVPELDISYFLNEKIAFELILGVTPHDVSTKDLEVPVVGTLGSVDLGDVWLLPPTLTAQYHFTQFGSFKPYIGAGVNYTLFFNEDEGSVADSIDYDPSFGPALQAGFDYDLDGEKGGWAINVDVKKVWINTDVTVDLTSALGTALGAQSVIVDADVDIDPVILGVGMGYKF
ncbi:OmpW/AlkL family protein [Hirschia litorea]|uniref:OmpW family protein n=1 Tax=Hirschia litorea TaxID=1199156 RepID=A0ABW2IJ60_9PROT